MAFATYVEAKAIHRTSEAVPRSAHAPHDPSNPTGAPAWAVGRRPVLSYVLAFATVLTFNFLVPILITAGHGCFE